MKTFPRKLAATIIVLGFATSASYAAIAPAPQQDRQASAPAAAVTTLARKGADDGRPQPRPDDTGCDDNGTDVCNTIVAKRGADDGGKPRPDDTGCDDHGTDSCRAPAMLV